MSAALVSGCASTRGIGYATATHLAVKGWDLALVDHAAAPLRQAAEKIARSTGVRVLPLVCDVTSAADVNAAVEVGQAEFGGFHALVNNAGITSATRFEHITEEEWERIFAVDMKGVFLMTRAVLPSMREQRYGRIVNVASVAGKRGGGIIGGVHYAAAKAAVLGFTKALAREVAREGITSNAVAPGLIDTEIAANLSEERRQEWIDGLPVGRLGRPEDVAAGIGFLCSESAGYITGEEIDINGGMHID